MEHAEDDSEDAVKETQSERCELCGVAISFDALAGPLGCNSSR